MPRKIRKLRPKRPADPRSTDEATTSPKDEDALWAAAISDVQPLDNAPRIPTPQRRQYSEPKKTTGVMNPADARELMTSAPAFDLKEQGMRISGRAPDVDRRILKRLERGEFPLEGEIDLHGLRAEPARASLERFLDTAWRDGRRCLLVIHGQGQHGDGSGVIRRALPSWLSSAPLASRILCFCSALPRDGGPGATKVLLRSSGRRR